MTGAIPSHNDGKHKRGSGAAKRLEIDIPVVADGPALHRITRASGVLDLNSCYAYLLWCRDFARTSAVARLDGDVVGFVTGFLRPEEPETLLVWQVAVDACHRGTGVAGKLLNNLVDRLVPCGVRYLETTISADNSASIRLFSRLAESRSAEIARRELFPADLFPDAHLGEDLYRIGPFSPGTPVAAETISARRAAAVSCAVEAESGRSDAGEGPPPPDGRGSARAGGESNGSGGR